MILFTSALNVFMVQTLELDIFIQDYFRETITNFLAVHRENGFLVLQIYPRRGEKVKSF